jgi:hypothetical protein
MVSAAVVAAPPGVGLRGPFVSRPSTNAIGHRPRRGPPARVWTRKSSPAPAPSELAGHAYPEPSFRTPAMGHATHQACSATNNPLVTREPTTAPQHTPLYASAPGSIARPNVP